MATKRRKTKRKTTRRGGLGATAAAHRPRARSTARLVIASAKSVDEEIKAQNCKGAVNELLDAAYFLGNSHTEAAHAGMDHKRPDAAQERFLKAKNHFVNACVIEES